MTAWCVLALWCRCVTWRIPTALMPRSRTNWLV
ncbi:Uncharacterised protein [Vibrio cholerae]|nr:Uncharacterised protein [Vibrio cholerae]